MRQRWYRRCPPYFYPRSPWGERPSGVIGSHLVLAISIHAPRGGSDDPKGAAEYAAQIFLSTLPVGGATYLSPDAKAGRTISIHAPRGGSDEFLDTLGKWICQISIHAPRGGSDADALVGTPSWTISIHAPRGGSDSKHDNIPFIFATVYYAI